MLDRRMYFSSILLMFAALFLFQLSGVSKQAFSDYTKNRFAEETEGSEDSFSSDDLFDPLEERRTGSNTDGASNGTVVWLGEQDDIYNTLLSWCTYRRYALSTDAADIADGEGKAPVMVLVEGSDYDSYRNEVTRSVQESVPVVFCGLPADEELESDDGLRNLLGIDEIRGSVQLDGVRLNGGFLLGGARDYILDDDAGDEEQQNQDMNLETTWYLLGSGTESYLSGLVPEDVYGEVLTQYLPALVWRHSTAELVPSRNALTSAVFVVSTDYLQDETGLGILSAIESRTESYSLYPVVNAQSFALTDFPSLSSENEAQMMDLYSRSTESVIRDIVWPTVETVLDRTGAVPTYMIVPFLEDSSAVQADLLDEYLQRVRDTRGEAGISLRRAYSSLPQTLEADGEVLQNAMPDYAFETVYGRSYSRDSICSALDEAGLTDVTTVLMDRAGQGQDLLSVYGGTESGRNRSVVRSLGTADTHTFSEDLRMRSVETALGYSMITENLGRVLYPESEEDEWQRLSEQFSGNVIHYWEGFETFEKTALSTTGQRTAQYLTQTVSQTREGDTIHLSGNGEKASYYILRLYGEEPVTAAGGSYAKIEDGSWLVTMDGQAMELTVRSVNRIQ